MKRPIVATLALACVALSACTTEAPIASTGAPPPSTWAQRTTADERAMNALELAYTAARALNIFGSGATLDRAEAAMEAARAAYRAANSGSWLSAWNHAVAVIAELRRAAGR